MKRIVTVVLLLANTFLSVPACSAQVRTDGAKAAGGLAPIRPMSSKRAAHTSTLLANGNVLVAGGFVSNGGSLESVELFDPRSGEFNSTAGMSAARAAHTATRLPDGRVLIAGGYNGNYLATAELYDPATNRFSPAGRMTGGRSGHVATLLNDGRVLLAGGVGTGWTFLASAELYDPATNTFTVTASMSVPRESHTSTLLPDGKVLVTGGHTGRRAAIAIYTSAEIYDAAAGRFAPAPDMTVKRHKHEAVRLNDGRILILGGSDERDGDGAYKNAEIFNPTTGRFSAVANSMTMSRYKLQGTAVVLRDGKVFIAGGSTRAELFDPATDRFIPVDGDMRTKKLFATATLLSDGRVLVTGGYTDGNLVSDGAWLYRG